MTRDINRAMADYLPRYYADIRESNEIINAGAAGIAGLNANINDVLAQFFVETATWGLTRWEQFIGDKNAGNYDQTTYASLEEIGARFNELEATSWSAAETKYPTDIVQRRANVKAKIRGFGTVTHGLIKSVTESYANGQVEVIEDSANFTISIKFVGELGVPAKIASIKEALREIIPAHLAIVYEFMYITYGELASKYTNYNAMVAAGKTYDAELNGW